MAIHVGTNGLIGRLIFQAPHGVADRQRRRLRADKVMHLSTAGGHANIPITAPAMKSGAVEFLTKPFGDQAAPETGPGRAPAELSQ